MAAISTFRVTQHSQIFHLSLETEINALQFVNYTVLRFRSIYAVAILLGMMISLNGIFVPSSGPLLMLHYLSGDSLASPCEKSLSRL